MVRMYVHTYIHTYIHYSHSFVAVMPFYHAVVVAVDSSVYPSHSITTLCETSKIYLRS